MTEDYHFFKATSSEVSSQLTITFSCEHNEQLGAQLINLDKGEPDETFNPAYASIGRVLEGDNVARRCGVAVGDCIVAVNGEGFRRHALDCDEHQIKDLAPKVVNVIPEGEENGDATISRFRVLSGKEDGENYAELLKRIKDAKSTQDSENPLIISLERYGWDSRVNSWSRFLAARDKNIPEAMLMLQAHENWRDSVFPIDVSQTGFQNIVKARAISEVDTKQDGCPPTVCVNFSKIQALESSILYEDVVSAFVVYTELLLSRASNPLSPKTCQFIDLSGTRITRGLNVGLLRKIYAVFEPNYPETLHKMVMYPVSRIVRQTSNVLLNFVNQKTREKFVITDDLNVVCKELGWDKNEVEEYGGITQFMQKHQKDDDTLILT